MYQITRIVVKNDVKHKALYDYFTEQCHNYKSLNQQHASLPDDSKMINIANPTPMDGESCFS